MILISGTVTISWHWAKLKLSWVKKISYFVDLSHDVGERVLVGGRFFLKVISIEPKHRHHEFVDVLVRDVERVCLVLKVQVDNLKHFWNFEGSNIFVDIEVGLFDQEDITTLQHFLCPLKLDRHISLLVAFQDDEADVKVAGERNEVGLVLLSLQLLGKLGLIKLEEEPEVSNVALEGLEVVFLDRDYLLVHADLKIKYDEISTNYAYK